MTQNGYYLLNWNYIYRDINSVTDDYEGTTSIPINLGPLWESYGILIDGILYLFYMENRLKGIVNNYKKNEHHHLLCFVKDKNTHLNGQEADILSLDLFNELDDKDLTTFQIEKAKDLLGHSYSEVKEVQVFTLDKKNNIVKLNKLNSFGEIISSINVTEADFTILDREERSNVPRKTIATIKRHIQRDRNNKIKKEQKTVKDNKKKMDEESKEGKNKN
ncbi:DUF5986 family protein [Streptococcus mutans]|uniref:DUF5986 family protein n=1 Tax=Streptococcus mutans TaxID=1309 RepID=UPI00237942F7|nr:DUF5986 family protein [Streptococcus mutans]